MLNWSHQSWPRKSPDCSRKRLSELRDSFPALRAAKHRGGRYPCRPADAAPGFRVPGWASSGAASGIAGLRGAGRDRVSVCLIIEAASATATVSASKVARFVPTMCLVVDMPAK